MRRGQADVAPDFMRPSGDLTEDEVRGLVPGVALRCDPLPGNDQSLGDRVCDGWIKSFNGIRAYQIAFFFRQGTLANAKVDVPWWQHRCLGRHLLARLGRPTGMQH